MSKQVDPQVTQAGVAALQAWRHRKIAAGVPADQLPLERDFEKILLYGPDARGLGNRVAVQRHRQELLALVASASKANGSKPVEFVDVRDPAEKDGAASVSGSSAPVVVGLEVVPDPSLAATSELEVLAAQFAPWEFDPEAKPPGRSLKVTVPPGGGLRYRWADLDGESAAVSLYRVVIRDDYPPTNPDHGGLRAVTEEPEWIDRQPFSTPLRHVQIWVNRGPNRQRALGSQPQLLVQSVVVPVPDGVAIGQEGRQVVGRWTVPDGVDRVQVYRIPMERVSLARVPDPDDLVCDDDPNLTGFRDEAPPTGRFQYRFYSAVRSDGSTELSAMVSYDVEVVERLLAVTDLRAVREAADDSLVSLEWARSGADEIRVYRSRRRPAADAGDQELPVAALEQAGLLEAERLLNRVEDQQGRQRMNGVSVADVSGRVHFTPVSIRGDRARVGRTWTHRRLAAVTDARLVQRVDWQLVSFGWPDGATHVHVHLTAPGARLDDVLRTPDASVDRDEWLLRGGIQLRRVLPRGPAGVHVTPVITGAPTEAGPTTVLAYRGLVTLRYRLQVSGGGGSLVRKIIRTRTLEVHSDTGGKHRLRFILVHNAARLPLSRLDGIQVHQRVAQMIRDEWVSLGEFSMPSGGFTRAFVESDGEAVDIAVIDPPLSTLHG